VRDLILNNFWWKVTALFLAILVWLGFEPRDKPLNLFPDAYRPSYVRYLLLHPVTILKSATDTREFKVTPSEADIALSGDEKVLEALKGREVRASVDVGAFSLQTNLLPIQVTFPPTGGIKLERVSPERVQVELLKE